MSEEKLSFLNTPAPEPEPEPAEAVTEEAPQDAGATPEPEAEAPRARDPDTGRFIPIAAVLDERDKRQAAERRAQELEQRLSQYTQQQEEYVPTDPREIIQYTLAEQQKIAFNERLNISELMARQAYGDDEVTAAQQAFMEASQSDPNLAAQLQGQVHPYDWVLRWHKSYRLMSEIAPDPEAWRSAERERLRQELLQEIQGTAQRPASSKPSQQPPPSVVSLPSSGRAGQTPTGPGLAFEGLFRRG